MERLENNFRSFNKRYQVERASLQRRVWGQTNKVTLAGGERKCEMLVST